MSGQNVSKNRLGLTRNQIAKLQEALDEKAHGKVIVVRAGRSYGAHLELIAQVGERLTAQFTSHFDKDLPVHFVMLGSGKSNAYAYWMNSFEAICMTTTLAQEIAGLCGDVAEYLVRLHGGSGGFAYLQDVAMPPDVKHAALTALLIRGVMAFFIGHEVGHVWAGHKPIMVRTTAATAEPDGDRQEAAECFGDAVIAEAAAGEEGAGGDALRLNAHELDADVQGMVLTAAFWRQLRDQAQAGGGRPEDAALRAAAMASHDRLLLLASSALAIAMSLMSFKQFSGAWLQPTHPLTAVRCLVGLRVLANALAETTEQYLTLELPGPSVEALTMVHMRLASLVLKAGKVDGQYSDLALQLKHAPGSDDQVQLMYRATGVSQAVERSNDVVAFLAQLGAEFNACAPLRARALHGTGDALVQWSAVPATSGLA